MFVNGWGGGGGAGGGKTAKEKRNILDIRTELYRDFCIRGYVRRALVFCWAHLLVSIRHV